MPECRRRLVTGGVRYVLAFGLACFFNISLSIAQEIDLSGDRAVDTRRDDGTAPADEAGQTSPSDAAARAAEIAEESDTGDEAPSKTGRAAGGGPPSSFLLRDIRFTPSGYLTKQDLADAEAALVGRRYRVDQLGNIAKALTALYQAKNIALAQVNITGLGIEQGLLDVELFEARIGAVSYEADHISDEYLAWRLGLKGNDLADNRRIDQALNRLAQTDGLTFDADFNPGAERGLTDIAISATGGSRYFAAVSADNYGSQSNGTYRLTGTAGVRSLTGWNDPLTISATRSRNSTSVSGNYGRVVLPGGTNVNIFGSFSQADVPGLISQFDQSWNASFGVNVPLILGGGRSVFSFANVQSFGAVTRLGSVDTTDQMGWSGTLGLTGARTGTYGDGTLAWSAGGSFSVGYGVYDDTVFSISDQNFLILSAAGNATVQFTPDWLVSFRTSGQYAVDEAVPKNFDFMVTSPFVVRGYPVSLSSGDSGYFARLQLERVTNLPNMPVDATVRPFLFADIGEAFDVANGDHEGQGVAASAGFGLAFGLGEHLAGDIYVAKPFTDLVGYTVENDDYVVRGSLTSSF